VTKAEIERAISTLEARAQQATVVLATLNCATGRYRVLRSELDDLENALTCLREALKRAEGCPVCRGKELLYGHPGAFPVKVDASPYGSTLDVKIPDYGGAIEFSVEISYCPNCGRWLGEEAQR